MADAAELERLLSPVFSRLREAQRAARERRWDVAYRMIDLARGNLDRTARWIEGPEDLDAD